MRYRVQVVSRNALLAQGGLLLAVLACAVGVRWLSDGAVSVLTEAFYFLALAQLWNLLAGYAGVVSLGQHAFLGLGGYVLFALVMFADCSPWTALPAAGVAGALVSLPAAFLVFRLRGAHLAIGTWVLAEALRLGFAQIGPLGAGSGISLPAAVASAMEDDGGTRDTQIYLAALLLCVAVHLCAYLLLRSRLGLAMTAIRDNEMAAVSSGVAIRRVRYATYVAVAFATAMIGALIYLYKFRISPAAAFDVNWTSYAIFIVVIGGVGTLEGPLIGTVLFFLLREYLADLGGWYLVILGALAVAVMLRLPAGLWGTLAARYDLHLFPTRRRLLTPDDFPPP